MLNTRIRIYGITFFILWPMLSIIIGAGEGLSMLGGGGHYYKAFLLCLGGGVLLYPAFALIGLLLKTGCFFFFYVLEKKNCLHPMQWNMSLICEPFLLFLSVFFGTAIHYPSILNHSLLFPLHKLPVWIAMIALLASIIFFSSMIARARFRLKLSVMAILIGCVIPLPAALREPSAYEGAGEAPLVLLGLDSLSFADDLHTLMDWCRKINGTWYSKAVSPGLLTNSVWTSLLTIAPVHEHGVFNVFQTSQRLNGNDSLVHKAKRHGYRTLAIFPDQFTCWVGSGAGFDDDKNGPIGWRQVATVFVEDASLLLPLFRPVFPWPALSSIPSNHSGTFTYSIDRELDGIFNPQSHAQKYFVAAHLTFLHTPCYPKYSDLSAEERNRILASPVRFVKDRSLNWQSVDRPNDAIMILKWKIERLFRAVIASVERTRFIERGGRLLLFSDHGDRIGLTPDNFCDERFSHILMMTIGLPATINSEKSISPLDGLYLLGISNRRDFEPIVEFTIANPSEWEKFMVHNHLRWSGEVDLDQNLLAEIFARLRSCAPFRKGAKVR